MVREVAMVAGLVAALPALAGEMTANEARHLVVGEPFSYSCFDGTRGKALVNADGSVFGSIRFQSGGPTRYAELPPGTLRIEGGRVCASLRGLVVQPCFYLERTNANSFRGSITGMTFAYCDFTRDQGRADVVHSGRPIQLGPPTSAEAKE